MQTDPMEEWRRLTTLYSEMGDVEIRELTGQIQDLTPTAQQVLGVEMKKRGMDESGSKEIEPPVARPADSDARVHWEPASYTYVFSKLPDENDSPHEYSWKTELRLCDSPEEAWQVGELLRRAGIDSWIQGPSNRAGLDGSRVLVAADQLEAARAVAAQPIPQDIIDASKELNDVTAYENPVCPKCRAADPTLESVEPSNNWLCESCGYAWSDPVTNDAGDAKSSA
jgi:hypothetical protein